jgi:pyruvate/2-oxoglutarate dehydrogenase complex dihydrolipoamide dehydrogenase (E3) component
MTENDRYDVLIIGAGQAGIPLAHDVAKAGKRVALAEEKHLGGSCVNFGCTPTKAVVASARVAHLARRGVEFGLEIPTVDADFPAVLARAKRILTESRDGLERKFENSDNPKLLRGSARFEGRENGVFRVAIAHLKVAAQQVVIDTGTRSTIPPIEGLDDVAFICAENWLEQPELPEHLAVVGGGYIGLEMSQVYRRLGSRVTVIEEGKQVASHEDEDVAHALQQLLEGEGIEFRMNTRVKRLMGNKGPKGAVTLRLADDAGSSEIKASHVFIATGRTPNTDDLGLETIGVRVSESGIVETNQRLATNVEGIWAAGDIRGGPMFTHTAWDDYRILSSQIAGDGSRTTRRVVPYAIFTDPQLGRVGVTEREAGKAGNEIRVSHYEMKKNSRAREFGEIGGFIKVIVAAETKRILGAAVLASEGAELVHIYVDLINADAPYTVVRDAIHIHPTLAEAVQSAVTSFD